MYRTVHGPKFRRLADLLTETGRSEYGTMSEFRPTVNDIQSLEKDGLFVPVLGKPIKGTVVSVVADNLGAHSVAGNLSKALQGHTSPGFCVGERSKFQSNELLPVDMAPSAKLRIIFGEDDVRKLFFPAGTPSTLQALNDVLRETFDITGPFTVMSQDMVFRRDLESHYGGHVRSRISSSTIYRSKLLLIGCDTILLSAPDESGPSYRVARNPDLLERWPSLFCENQIKEEFKRITTIQSGANVFVPIGRHHVDGRRDIIIRCLVEYLGESGEELIKEFQFSAPVFPPWGPSTLGVVLVYQHGCRPIDSSSLGGWRTLHLCVEPLVCLGQGGHCVGTPCGQGR
ncbi:hypothetical protein QQF64_034018 [Cirrhinus molitorella]|uniref:Uncharacterized protein n=1 Tax=Cirrhinus molitorella TaxID=172907 RepID=A0ABR3MVI0_9TELE